MIDLRVLFRGVVEMVEEVLCCRVYIECNTMDIMFSLTEWAGASKWLACSTVRRSYLLVTWDGYIMTVRSEILMVLVILFQIVLFFIFIVENFSNQSGGSS